MVDIFNGKEVQRTALESFSGKDVLPFSPNQRWQEFDLPTSSTGSQEIWLAQLECDRQNIRPITS